MAARIEDYELATLREIADALRERPRCRWCAAVLRDCAGEWVAADGKGECYSSPGSDPGDLEPHEPLHLHPRERCTACGGTDPDGAHGYHVGCAPNYTLPAEAIDAAEIIKRLADGYAHGNAAWLQRTAARILRQAVRP